MTEDIDQSDNADDVASSDVEVHRNAVGEMLQTLKNKGLDVDSIAERAGVSTADVEALSHDDVMTLTTYIAQNHPEVWQSVLARFPAAQKVIDGLSDSPLGGMLGGFFGNAKR